jgi:hypothetical protein
MKRTSLFSTGWSLMTAVLLISFLSSCGNRKSIRESFQTSTEDNAASESESSIIVDALNATARQGGQKTDSLGAWLPACATASMDTTVTPRTLTIDFGSTNCLCSNWDGKNRRGKLIATWSGRYRDAGTIITHRSENYYVDNNKLVWNHTATNNGPGSNGNYTFTIKAENCSYETTDGTISWNSTRTREWTQGYSTLSPSDDVYVITGSASGKNRQGDDFSITIDEGLKKIVGCKWLVSGKMTLTSDSKERKLDYGDGSCDNKAILTYNNKDYQINLK